MSYEITPKGWDAHGNGSLFSGVLVSYGLGFKVMVDGPMR